MLNDNSVDVCFTSPPYNRKRNDKYSNYDDNVENWLKWQIEVIEEMKRISKGYVIYNIQANFYNKNDVYKIIGNFHKDIKEIFIWEKTNPMPAPGLSITNAVEYFIFFSDKNVNSNTTYTKNIIKSSVNSKMPKSHKAVMKQEISDFFIENFTNKNDTVLDIFMGTGTTGVSCKKFKRNFIGIEKDREYFKIAIERIKSIKLDKTKE